MWIAIVLTAQVALAQAEPTDVDVVEPDGAAAEVDDRGEQPGDDAPPTREEVDALRDRLAELELEVEALREAGADRGEIEALQEEAATIAEVAQVPLEAAQTRADGRQVRVHAIDTALAWQRQAALALQAGEDELRGLVAPAAQALEAAYAEAVRTGSAAEAQHVERALRLLESVQPYADQRDFTQAKRALGQSAELAQQARALALRGEPLLP